MNKQCVNCPGATDHTTAECPVMVEASAPIDPIHSAMMLGMTPEPCEPVIEITRQAVTKLLDVVEFGDQLERVEKDRLVAFVKDLLAEEQPELWATYSPGPGEVHPCMTKEHAEREAKATIEVCEKMKAEKIARGQSVEFWPKIVVDVIPSPFTPLEHFELLAEETIQHRDDLVEYVKELEQKAEVPAPAVAMPSEIPRDLLGKIVDEVFDGAIEDPSVIEDVYRVIAREQPSTAAARDVLAERQRQITAEGWAPDHDDEHDGGELAAAGAAYALHAADYLNPHSQGDGGDEAPDCWPWHDGIAGRGEGPERTKPAWWKPGAPRRNLIKAGALILAEIERLDRAEQAKQQEQQP